MAANGFVVQSSGSGGSGHLAWYGFVGQVGGPLPLQGSPPCVPGVRTQSAGLLTRVGQVTFEVIVYACNSGIGGVRSTAGSQACGLPGQAVCWHAVLS